MAYKWPGGFTFQHFGPKEFKYPELMDPKFMQELDRLRMRCGFPLRINNDARKPEDMERIYAKEIAKGKPYPTTSAHLYIEPTLVRSVDIEPAIPKKNDGSKLSLEERELKLSLEILKMWEEGAWPYLGLGIETSHWHVDDTPRLGNRRPAFWVDVSR